MLLVFASASLMVRRVLDETKNLRENKANPKASLAMIARRDANIAILATAPLIEVVEIVKAAVVAIEAVVIVAAETIAAVTEIDRVATGPLIEVVEIATEMIARAEIEIDQAEIDHRIVTVVTDQVAAAADPIAQAAVVAVDIEVAAEAVLAAAVDSAADDQVAAATDPLADLATNREKPNKNLEKLRLNNGSKESSVR